MSVSEAGIEGRLLVFLKITGLPGKVFEPCRFTKPATHALQDPLDLSPQSPGKVSFFAIELPVFILYGQLGQSTVSEFVDFHATG